MTDLHARARALLAQASILAEARAQRLGSNLHQGKPGSSRPSGEGFSLYDALRRRFVVSWHVPPKLEQAVEWAEVEIGKVKRQTRRPPRVESQGQRDARIVLEGEGWSVRDVAVHFRCGERDVIRARRAAKRDEAFGFRVGNGVGASVRELRDRGLTVRQIAALTGVPKSTVHKELAA